LSKTCFAEMVEGVPGKRLKMENRIRREEKKLFIL
jgi:hypothetical protein